MIGSALRLRRGRYCAVALASLLTTAVGPAPARAELPMPLLTAVAPCGGRQGTVLELKLVAGAELEFSDALHFSHPGITAQPKRREPLLPGVPGETVPKEFLVTIAADVPPGIYDVCAVGPLGASTPRAFAVGSFPETAEEPNNHSPDKAMGVAVGGVVNATATAGASDFFKLAAKGGQRVLVEVWAQRVDSRMDPALVVYDAGGREIARSRDVRGLDPLVELRPTSDETYTLEVFDAVYQGGADCGYRLVITSGPDVEAVFPPAGATGSRARYTLYGRNLVSASASTARTASGSVEHVEREIQLPASDAAERAVCPLWMPATAAFVDFAACRAMPDATEPVLVGLAAAAPAAEQEPNDKPAQATKLKLPAEVAGQFNQPSDLDWFQFDAKKGEVFWIEVVCDRLGIAADPALVLQRVTKNDQGVETATDLAEQDDGLKFPNEALYGLASRDPAYRFNVPDDGTYRLLVRDLYAQGSPLHVYRLSIRHPHPDFRLLAVDASSGKNAKAVAPVSTIVPRGGSATLDVLAERRDGFAGEIDLSVEGLPAGISCNATVIGPGQDTATLVFQATGSAPRWAGAVRVVGRSKIDGKDAAHAARALTITRPGGQRERADTRLAQQVVISVAEGSVPLSIELAAGELAAPAGGKIEIPVKLQRRDGFNDAVVLTPAGLPAKAKAQPLTIAAGKNEGKLVLEIDKTCPPGRFSIYTTSTVKIPYRRGASVAEAAARAKTEIDRLAAEKVAAAQKAQADLKAALEQLKASEAALKKNANDEPAKAKLQDATTRKAAAEKTAAAAEPLAKAATAAKAAAEKRAAETAAAAAPKPLDATIAGGASRINITAAAPAAKK